MEDLVKKTNKSSVLIGIIVAGLVIAGAVIYVGYSKCPGQEGVIPSQQAADKAIKYINETILAGKATVAFKAVSEENGVYKVKFDLSGQEIDSYITKNGKLLFPQGYDLGAATATPNSAAANTIGDFLVSVDEVCKENDKPVVYFFGSTTCPHCIWEKPIIQEVAQKFGDKISFHENIVASTSETFKDASVFQKYNAEGGIPTLVLGCKYYRIGSGEQAGTETETKNLTALICKLTGGQPGSVCSQVQDLIDQAK